MDYLNEITERLKKHINLEMQKHPLWIHIEDAITFKSEIGLSLQTFTQKYAELIKHYPDIHKLLEPIALEVILFNLKYMETTWWGHECFPVFDSLTKNGVHDITKEQADFLIDALKPFLYEDNMSRKCVFINFIYTSPMLWTSMKPDVFKVMYKNKQKKYSITNLKTRYIGMNRI